MSDTLASGGKLADMAAGRSSATNNHLQEAMALLIRNQAAFVEQIARNDQERLALQRRSDERDLKSDERQMRIEEWQRKTDERLLRTEEWQRKSDEQFMRIEKRFIGFEERLKRIETILLQLPQMLKKEIGFRPEK